MPCDFPDCSGDVIGRVVSYGQTEPVCHACGGRQEIARSDSFVAAVARLDHPGRPVVA